MKNKLFLSILLLFTVIFISFTLKEDHKILKIGKKAPLSQHKMKDISGKEYSLEDLNQENGLLVIFSCNTCPFVVGGFGYPGWEKEYNGLYDQAKANKIGMVLINSNEAKRDGVDALDKMVKHAEKQQYKMNYVVDKNHLLADAFGAKTTPHIFLFDKDLKLIYTGSIDNSWDKKRASEENYLKDALANISKGEKIKVNTSAPRGCSIKRVE
jgi:peroxiredoxin